MAALERSKLFNNSPKLDSHVKSANTTASEIWLGYFLGPTLLYMAYYSIAGTYLTQFHTDVLGLAGGLLYSVPKASHQVQLVWIIVSYNLFFALAFTIYNMSHTLMAPLSTRNTKQRDTLAIVTSAGASMLPGMLSAVFCPSSSALWASAWPPSAA